MAQPIGESIRSLEEKLLDPVFRRTPGAVATLLADEFLEFGSSGRRYDKTAVLAALAQEQGFSGTLSDFAAHELAPGLVLATFQASLHLEDGTTRHSLRSSLWQLRDSRWQMLFHQGTPSG